MKFLKKLFVFLLLLGLLKLGLDNQQNFSQAHRNYVHRKTNILTQKKTQHMITFLNEDGERAALCTGTAVGPHALLTASHCNDGEGPEHHDTVTLDLSMEHFHLLAETEDGRDHVIYLLDGPAFTNYLPESALLDVASPESNETVFLCGDGLGAFPPVCRFGYSDAIENDADVSDVNKYRGLFYYIVAIVPGDSGAAIFGLDGRVVGVVTYGIDAADRVTPSQSMAGFGLKFKKSVLDKAQTFSIEKVEEDLKNKEAEARK